ncbi:MAG: hypothetical protein M1449_14220 [Candidatus Thermoplasmatota archaeon]|nr:hypothetical protein [Candidatus Thermoplasmatota archaeon]
MAAPQYHDTHEIVIAATLWLMRRYQQTGCKKLAHMVEQHLCWMQISATSPVLANACERLSFEWRAVSCAAHSVLARHTLH